MAAILCACPVALAQEPAGSSFGDVVFSGHYRNLAARSTTTFGGDERFFLDANRLRLEWKGQLRRNVGIEVQYDNEVLVGDYLRTRQFAVESAQPRRTYRDLENVYAAGDNVQGRHRLRRANVTFARGATDVRVGRQRIAWGTGRFWSPLDLLNPVSPTALEPGEREGADALLVEHKRSAVSRISAVYAPVRGGRDHLLGQWHGNRSGVDYSVTAGQVPEGKLVGLDLAGQVGGAGLRAEWTVTRSDGKGTPHRLLLGWDYAFANTLTLSAEVYFDGSGSSDPLRYDFAALLAGQRQTVGRRYAGLHASYELTPLLKTQNWIAANLDDRSWYFSPRLVYSATENLELSAGAQWFGGSAAGEFGRRRNLYFISLQRFF